MNLKQKSLIGLTGATNRTCAHRLHNETWAGTLRQEIEFFTVYRLPYFAKVFSISEHGR